MAIGVCALILVLSVMNGFNTEMAGRLQTLAPHLTITSRNHSDSEGISQLLSSEGTAIEAISPLAESFVMLSSERRQRPMKLLGIDPVAETEVTLLSEKVVTGTLEDLRPGEFGVVLGSYAASDLTVSVGDSIKVILPSLRVTPVGLFPRQKNFRVVGIFDSGSQLDADFAYAHHSDVSRVLGSRSGSVGWRARLGNLEQADTWAAKIESSHPSWSVATWQGDYQSLFQAMKMEKITVGTLLMIIVLVAAFNIVSGLIMMVSDKRGEMAVLRTMGASSSVVIWIFVVQGSILGLTGILFGALVGTLLALNLSDLVGWFAQTSGTSLFDPSVYYVSFLPSEWRLGDFLWVIVCASILTAVATLVPAIQAAKISPREALNYKQ